MNPVLLLVRDNFEMNMRCIDSIFAQDIPTTLVIIDNSEGDETLKWALDKRVAIYPFRPQIGVSRGWNLGLSGLFRDGFEHVLVPNSDVVLPPWIYRRLLRYNAPFVTGVAVDSPVESEPPFDPLDLNPHPDFSCYLIHRSAWEIVGEFDSRMNLYCSDCAWHIEAHRKGLPLWKSNSPYFHINSQTLKRANPNDRANIEAQANADRAVFQSIYGCLPGSPAYYDLFKGGDDA